MAERPLTVEIDGDELVIRIGASTLAMAAHFDPKLAFFDEDLRDYFEPEVTDEAQWAREIRSALMDEEEDGTTLVHRMLDTAALSALENGAEGIRSGQEMADVARAARDFPPEAKGD